MSMTVKAILAVAIFAAILAYDRSNQHTPHVEAGISRVPVYLQADHVRSEQPGDFYVTDGTNLTVVSFGIATTRVRFKDGREGWLPTSWVK